MGMNLLHSTARMQEKEMGDEIPHFADNALV
jgi:hypothetical protein